ncbi:MAG TPA: hypothetical protein VG308_20405 [Stellaceae bacterium]|nr:hypothetical protein [Stellaceae bacterium]
MKQTFAQAANESCRIRPGDIFSPQIIETRIERALLESARKGACIDRQLGEIVIKIQPQDVPGYFSCIFLTKINRHCAWLNRVSLQLSGLRHIEPSGASRARALDVS